MCDILVSQAGSHIRMTCCGAAVPDWHHDFIMSISALTVCIPMELSHMCNIEMAACVKYECHMEAHRYSWLDAGLRYLYGVSSGDAAVMHCQSIHGENVTISFKHEYRRHTLTSRCDVISDVMNIKNNFYVIMCDVLSISYVKMNLSQIFRNFQNGRHFEVQVRYWTGSCTGIWVIHQDRLCHSLHFEILFDVLA